MRVSYSRLVRILLQNSAFLNLLHIRHRWQCLLSGAVDLLNRKKRRNFDQSAAMISRRRFLASIGPGLAACARRRSLRAPEYPHARNTLLKPTLPYRLSRQEDEFLEDLSRRAFRYFWEQSDPLTGITRGRAHSDGSAYKPERENLGSTGVTGFGITALCIGAERGWIARDQARRRARAALLAYADGPVRNEHGWFYHWVNVETGERTGATFDTSRFRAPAGLHLRQPKSEISTSDSTWLLAGALTAGQYFTEDPEIAALASRIYRRMDYRWMLNGDPFLLSHGWMPETGFIRFRYDRYCQLACMYLLGIGSPTHPLKPESWYAWTRNPYVYDNFHYIGTSLLWTFQYSHAWIDLRNRREARGSRVDWFQNSVTATRAHKAFCLDLAPEFPGCYSQNIWGITSSMSKQGYRAWGGPPRRRGIDGTVVPCAPAGSLVFTPGLSLPALRQMRERYGEDIYGRYGFTDAFNPGNGWVSRELVGLNTGITLLAAENLRSGKVWKWFMSNPEVKRALQLADIYPVE
jgi:hypothetical protein